MEVLLIDNYDSFSYNLVECLRQISSIAPKVIKNDALCPRLIAKYQKVILSPGPGLPVHSGQLCSFIKEYYKSKSILGICLGHQAINEVLGGTLKQLRSVYHGLSTGIYIEQPDILFDSIEERRIFVGRYHSWVIDRPAQDIVVTARDAEGHIMAFCHKKYQLYGVQFHPESILTPYGKTILANWLLN